MYLTIIGVTKYPNRSLP